MNCLCCGKPLLDNEQETGWHKACIRRFFGTSGLPELELSDEILKKLVLESVNKGYTVPGVQKKMSLHLSSEGKPRLTLMDYPTGYILKPQVAEFPSLPESEQLVMTMASECGISVVPHALLKQGDGVAYITKRVDRELKKDKSVKLLAMEDFCQLDERLTEDKYRGSYERCAKIIQRFSSRSGLDVSELFLRLVFSFLTGNSDMHLKNFSLLETGEGSARYVLSPAYDLLPVHVAMPEDTEEFALALQGKKRNLRRSDFVSFAEGCAIGEKAAEKMLSMLLSKEHMFQDMIAGSLLPEVLKKRFSALLSERATRLRLA